MPQCTQRSRQSVGDDLFLYYIGSWGIKLRSSGWCQVPSTHMPTSSMAPKCSLWPIPCFPPFCDIPPYYTSPNWLHLFPTHWILVPLPFNLQQPSHHHCLLLTNFPMPMKYSTQIIQSPQIQYAKPKITTSLQTAHTMLCSVLLSGTITFPLATGGPQVLHVALHVSSSFLPCTARALLIMPEFLWALLTAFTYIGH